jgi:hypothetical protein
VLDLTGSTVMLIYNTIFTERDTYTSKLKHNRTIIHIDIDCFYAQVEMIRNPQLREKPLGKKQQTKFSKNIITVFTLIFNPLAQSLGQVKLDSDK